jgi:ribosomal protein S26
LPPEFQLLSYTLDREKFTPRRTNSMARKTVLVCDNCGAEVDEGKGATLRINYTDARRGSKQADLCDNCAGQMPGRAAARRGRRPKAASAA